MNKKQDITNEDVEHVAQLSNLKLSKNQIKELRKQLAAVIKYIAKLQELDIALTKETSQVTNLTNKFREDKVDSKRILSQKEALLNAKKTHNGYFVVDSVFN